MRVLAKNQLSFRVSFQGDYSSREIGANVRRFRFARKNMASRAGAYGSVIEREQEL
jgi:hypothetical protein